MDTNSLQTGHTQSPLGPHLANVAENLQLVADLGYGDVALAIPDGHALRVVADARPVTAVAAVAASRAGQLLARSDEPEAYDAFEHVVAVIGTRRRVTRGIGYHTSARPVMTDGRPAGVVIRDVVEQVTESPGAMEIAFMSLAERVVGLLACGPIIDIDSGEPFTTVRRAGDGIMEVDGAGIVCYASPNAVNIMRLAGLDGAPVGREAAALPGGATAIAPVLHTKGARAVTLEVGGRVLRFRTIGFDPGACVLVLDITDVRRREQEIRVKEATIREVHHRVKNNLQTIASLLRIQARRTTSEEAARALAEAVERVSSMAVVHEMLATATEESVDFTAVARTVVDMVRRSMAGDSEVSVDVEGEIGLIPASTATSLALVCAELVHNAIEHGVADRPSGRVTVAMRQLPDELHLVVRDDGAGLPETFDPESSANLGLAIVKTVVEDDLQGTLAFSRARGATVTVRVPLGRSSREDD
ncbi:MAG: histidine kinase N-terminal domain-containing protein [Coriobacteriales bacterium]|nr:sensor histidine kinase [Actinomycetes bacterium]